MLEWNSLIVLTKTLEVVDLAGEKAMIDFETGKYYLLKGAANDIWEHINNEISVKELIDMLLENFDIDRETCFQNTVTFLGQLHKIGFLTVRQSNGKEEKFV